MKKLNVGNPITETSCCACGGGVMIKVGGGKGNLPVGRCTNELEDSGLVCGTWFTLGRNAEYALRKRIEQVSNDNEKHTLEHQNDNDESEDSATGEEATTEEDSTKGEVSSDETGTEASTEENSQEQGLDGENSKGLDGQGGRQAECGNDTEEAKISGAEADSGQSGIDNKPVNDNTRILSLAEKRRAARTAAKS